jgi:ankyrin repeat protein
VGLSTAATLGKQSGVKDPLEPSRAALRTLQFSKAIDLLTGLGNTGNADAQYLLGLIYLNGIGAVPDAARARGLLQTAADHGQGAAAYVLAAELSRDKDAPPGAAHTWLEQSAKLGYVRAVDALQSGRPLLARESVGASDPTLLLAWVIDRARKNDAVELRRLGAPSASVLDEFGRGPLFYAAEAGAVAAATVLIELGADIRAVDKAGTNAVMVAAQRPETATLELLLQHGADAQAVDLQKRTALFYAARADRPAAIKILQHAGTTIDARDERGYNALDVAMAVDAEAAATEFRSQGMHANLVTVNPGRQTGKFDVAHPGEIYRGWPPLALAVSRNDATAVQQLLASGAAANLKLPQGDPLIQVAADAHAMESLQLVLAHGADVTATDHAGHSLLWLATSRGDGRRREGRFTCDWRTDPATCGTTGAALGRCGPAFAWRRRQYGGH